MFRTILLRGARRGEAVGFRWSGADLATNRTTLNYQRLALNARTAADLFAQMRHASIVRAWAGIEGMMPDGIPVIGPSSTHERAWHAFGFSAHGFELGPIVGSIVADLVTEGASRLPIAPFAISRFAAKAS